MNKTSFFVVCFVFSVAALIASDWFIQDRINTVEHRLANAEKGFLMRNEGAKAEVKTEDERGSYQKAPVDTTRDGIVDVSVGQPIQVTAWNGAKFVATIDRPRRNKYIWNKAEICVWLTNPDPKKIAIVPDPGLLATASLAGGKDTAGNEYRPNHERVRGVIGRNYGIHPGEIECVWFTFDRPVEGATVTYTIPLTRIDGTRDERTHHLYARFTWTWEKK